MFTSAEMGNIPAMMTDEHLFREEHGPYNDIVGKLPLFESFQHVIGKQH